MGRVFGGGDNINSHMYMPLSSCEWSIDGVASKGEYDNVALYGLTIDDQEAIDIRRCFNDVTHIFAFGRNFRASYIAVTLICFLGEECKSGNRGFQDLADLRATYDHDARIYKSLRSLTIEIDSLVVKGFLIGMTVGNVDPNHETCTITFTFIPDEEV